MDCEHMAKALYNGVSSNKMPCNGHFGRHDCRLPEYSSDPGVAHPAGRLLALATLSARASDRVTA